MEMALSAVVLSVKEIVSISNQVVANKGHCKRLAKQVKCVEELLDEGRSALAGARTSVNVEVSAQLY